MIEYKLPYPPSVNHYWIERAVRTKAGYHRVMKTVGPKGTAFRAEVNRIVNEDLKLVGNFVRVHIDAYPPDRRKRDIDNILKATLDALEHAGAYDNDSQIKYLSATKHDPIKGGAMTVTLSEEKE